MPLIKSKEDIAALRTGGVHLAETLVTLAEMTQPGVNLLELEERAKHELDTRGVTPSFLGFEGYPAASCLSVNDEVVHGIPRDYVLQDGDVLGIDLGLWHQKRCVDAAITVPVGNVSGEVLHLLEGTRKALQAGISAIKPYRRVGAIGSAIASVASEYAIGIIRSLTGHGVGHGVHEEPSVPNDSRPDQGILLRPGMVLAIEPMCCLGESGIITTDVDGWTIRTADGTAAAQFEKTVLVTERGCEVLTSLPPTSPLASTKILW